MLSKIAIAVFIIAGCALGGELSLHQATIEPDSGTAPSPHKTSDIISCKKREHPHWSLWRLTCVA